MTKIENLIKRKDSPLSYEWVLEQSEATPEWIEIYNCPNHSNKCHNKAQAYVKIGPAESFEMYLWCARNCKGKWSSWAEYMGDPVPGTEEGFAFEDPDDCVRFKLTFDTISIDWEKYGLKNPLDR
jgi:hypothetical protein